NERPSRNRKANRGKEYMDGNLIAEPCRFETARTHFASFVLFLFRSGFLNRKDTKDAKCVSWRRIASRPSRSSCSDFLNRKIGKAGKSLCPNPGARCYSLPCS